MIILFFSERGLINDLVLPHHSGLPLPFTGFTTEKIQIITAVRLPFLRFPVGFPVLPFYVRTEMRITSLQVRLMKGFLLAVGESVIKE